MNADGRQVQMAAGVPIAQPIMMAPQPGVVVPTASPMMVTPQPGVQLMAGQQVVMQPDGQAVIITQGLPAVDPYWAAQDKEASQYTWIMYLGGWALCVCQCFIPYVVLFLTPALWLGAGLWFYCRPVEQKPLLPNTHCAAFTSLVTLAIASVPCLLCYFLVLSALYASMHLPAGNINQAAVLNITLSQFAQRLVV